MARNDPLITATAALYLACKVEEQPRSVKTVAEAVFKTAHRHKTKAIGLLAKEPDFSHKLKEKVLLAERALLYSLGFDLELQHPTQLVLDFLQAHYNRLLPEDLRVSPARWGQECDQQSGPSYDVMNQLSVVAWNLCLSSYQLLEFLQYEATHLAAASIYVGALVMGLRPCLQNGWHWWEQEPLSVNTTLLAEIAGKLLELYETQEVPKLQMEAEAVGKEVHKQTK